jgi:cytochrome c peroxidase
MLAVGSLWLSWLACDQTEIEPLPTPEPAPEQPPAPPPAPAGYAWQLPKGLAEPPVVPDDNPMTDDKVALGHQLFMDPRLSVDGSRSCYSCHVNERGNADGRATALGAGNKVLNRNTPTIWNVGYLTALYWDGRADSLEKVAIGAWKGGNMGVGDGLDAKAAEIGALPEYGPRIRAAFGLADSDPITPDHIAKALSAYERTLLCGDTPADRFELSDSARVGKTLFENEARCIACHVPPHFTDNKFHDIGLGYDKKGYPHKESDPGRGKHTQVSEDNGKFRTPTLRNVSKTGPYFHNGSVATLEEAVRYMAKGGNLKAPNKDPLLVPAELTDAQIRDIVAYLEALACPAELMVLGDPLPVPEK